MTKQEAVDLKEANMHFIGKKVVSKLDGKGYEIVELSVDTIIPNSIEYEIYCSLLGLEKVEKNQTIIDPLGLVLKCYSIENE